MMKILMDACASNASAPDVIKSKLQLKFELRFEWVTQLFSVGISDRKLPNGSRYFRAEKVTIT